MKTNMIYSFHPQLNFFKAMKLNINFKSQKKKQNSCNVLNG